MPGEAPTNHAHNAVRVSLRKTIFMYINVVKRLLHEGEKEVEVSGLAASISNVVSIADILVSTGFARIIGIETSREEIEGTSRTEVVSRIVIRVAKADRFATLYAAEQTEREQRKSKREA